MGHLLAGVKGHKGRSGHPLNDFINGQVLTDFHQTSLLIRVSYKGGHWDSHLSLHKDVIIGSKATIGIQHNNIIKLNLNPMILVLKYIQSPKWVN